MARTTIEELFIHELSDVYSAGQGGTQAPSLCIQTEQS
ncbi:hypothetical protein ALP26_102481 [Pseudomonas savastanoi pv. glycinea]|uniref:Uncharacterized protein n=2 Tax=Pseudomonas savastanoi TaxID=29438 RepID=A0A0P9VGR0_PSESG|nr:Unknown protein sequence [Pseudomonas savastanoi pv. phaseolicola]KPB68320.1 Unknown protein sequence [Pseudomonas amygdali pv. mellea]KPC22167.1 Unknown protein sequence [Pseudomonas savastanoi pv. glycinea]KPB42654.1 Unknown protein sequence [Pseudomonas savastanoi pv. phaseolicola]KPB44701.1 Unknown protein sequence [Pseudomonas savastanoi pv. phaseolicola]